MSAASSAAIHQKRTDTRAIVSWALYDFAGAPFSVLIVTFIYATYFTKTFTADPMHGTALWSRGVSTTAVIVALCSPLLGALADRGGYRKLFLGIATVVCAVGSAGLFWVLPGQILPALSLVVVANVAFEFAAVFNNAFLPDLATRDKVGRLSGIGWASGYVGGLLALVIALVTLVNPAIPWFGFSTEAGENIRATNLLVGIWFLAFSVPLFLWVPEDRSRASPATHVVRDSFTQLKRTFTGIRKYRQIVRFLFARLLYNDGLVTVFAFGGPYAAVTFGFTFQEVIVFGIAINVAAVIGAVALAFLDDKIGGKLTIVISLVGLIAATLLAMFASTASVFWIAGISIGIFSGPNQAASRSLMARFVPRDVENEFFGFFAFSGKLTAFIGPALLGILTQWSGSQRVGVGVVVVLFVLGLSALTFVDEREGSRARAHDRG